MKDKVFVLGILNDVKEGIDNRFNMQQWNLLAKKCGLMERIDAAIDLDLNLETTSLIERFKKYISLEYTRNQWLQNRIKDNIDARLSNEISCLEKEINPKN